MYTDDDHHLFFVFRDIPMPLVSSGVEHGNLRELALARMKDLGSQCRDVRTREVGIQEIHHKVKPFEVESHEIHYKARNHRSRFVNNNKKARNLSQASST